MNFEIKKINLEKINKILNEIARYKSIYPFLPLSIAKNGLILDELHDRDTLRKTFEILNSSVHLNSLTNFDLGIDFKKEMMIWTYPQIRIDCSANRKFRAPYHKDKFILGNKHTGKILWIPLSKNGGSLNIVNKFSEYKVSKNDYWGVECLLNGVEEDLIIIDYGQALIFDEELIHSSSPLKEGQLTIQLRYYEANENFVEKMITQKSPSFIKDYQNKITE